jgi:outer membrane protein assembly factor BamB
MNCNVASIAVFLSIVCCRATNAAWPFQTGDYIPVSPSIADLDGDGDLEIVFGSWDGNCYCLDIDGNLVWATPLHDASGFPPQLHSSPTLIDLDGDILTREVVIGSAKWVGESVVGQLYCLSANGAVLDIFEMPTPVNASPLVCDLESDGVIEIVVGNVKSQFTPPAALYCLTVNHSEGQIELDERWNVSYEGGSIQLGPSAADIDSDGILEIFVSMNGTEPDQGSLFCLDAEGQVIWPFHVKGSRVYHTPAIADIDNDGFLEVLVNPFYNDTHCLDALTGSIEWVFPDPGSAFITSPAVANINDDEFLETVVGCYGADFVFSIRADGTQDWGYPIPEWMGFSSPSIADIDQDGQLEVVIGTDRQPTPYIPAHIYVFRADGSLMWAVEMPSAVYSSPSLADLDGDGFLEIAFGCYDHKFYVLDHNGNTFVPNPNTKPKDLAPWPTYRQNNQRTGFYPGPPRTPKVPGDIAPPGGNGIVDVDDLLAVINAWGECPPPGNKPCIADIAPAATPNNIVDVDDLLMVINNWS